MNFGLDNCATTSVVRSKSVESNNVILTNDITIPTLDIFDFYNYLGMFENAITEDSLIKNKVTTNYKKRIRNTLKSSLNGSNVIVAVNTWAVPLLHYTAGVVKWTQAQMKALDVSTRKLLAMHKCFNVNDDIHRLYVPCKLGGCGLLSVEDVVT